MTTATTNADYAVAHKNLGKAITRDLEAAGKRELPDYPKEVADELRGGYVRDAEMLTAIFTPTLHAGYVGSYELMGKDVADDDFLDFCIRELNEQVAYLALVSWPRVVGRDDAWSALSFPLRGRWKDKVAFLEEKEN